MSPMAGAPAGTDTTHPPGRGPLQGLSWLLLAGWVKRPVQNAGPPDPLGERVHLWFAMLWCFAQGFPISIMELSAIPLGVIFLIRLWRTHKYVRVVFAQPVGILCVMWAAWQFASLAWSLEPRRGVHEIGPMRFVWVIWAFWPVLHHRHKLIAAMAAGFLCANASQLAFHLGLHFPGVRELPDRNGGWWPAVFAGELLVAALGLHLPAAVMGRGRTRLMAAAGALVTLVGMWASGTRAAWVASAALITVVLGAALWTLTSGRDRLRLLGVTAVAALIVAGTVWVTAGPAVTRRFNDAWAEVDRALRNHDYATDNGLRIAMARWAFQAFAEHPIRGMGVGSFPAYVRAKAGGPDDAPARKFMSQDHGHCHNALLQA